MRRVGLEIYGLRELTAEDVRGLRRAKLPAVRKLRAIHRRIALLLAQGLSQIEVAEATGYSAGRVHMLAVDPAFANYVASLEGQISAGTVEDARDRLIAYNADIAGTSMLSEQIMRDRLERAIADGTEDDIPWAVLLKASRDGADRLGLAKRSVQVNSSADFAAQLGKAVVRSRMKVVSSVANPEVASAAPSGPGQGTNLTVSEGSPSGRSPGPVLIHDNPVVKPAGDVQASPAASPRPLVTRRA